MPFDPILHSFHTISIFHQSSYSLEFLSKVFCTYNKILPTLWQINSDVIFVLFIHLLNFERGIEVVSVFIAKRWTYFLLLDAFYKIKYKALADEVQTLRQKLLHEVEEEIEMLTTQKRQAEKQVGNLKYFPKEGEKTYEENTR